MTPVSVKAHSRRKPSKPIRYIVKHAELRMDIALADWSRTFSDECLEQIAREDAEQGRRIAESF